MLRIYNSNWTNYDQYTINMTYLRETDDFSKGYYKIYDPASLYGVKDLSYNEWNLFFERMKKNSTLKQLYCDNYYYPTKGKFCDLCDINPLRCQMLKC